MRIATEQLTEHLKRQSLPVYLLSGNESFLLEESADKIRQQLLKHNDVEHKRFNDTTSGMWEALQGELQHFSLFSSKQLIELRLSKFAAHDVKQLLNLLENLHSDFTLLLTTGQLSKQQQQAAWFKLIEQKGAVITHWPLTGQAFAKWVTSRAKQRGLTISEQELRLLIYHTEGNCLAASQEIEQLYWFYQNAEQNPTSTFAEQSQFTVFDLSEAALQHQAARVIKIVSCLKENTGSAEQLIIWSLSQTLRALLKASETEHEAGRRQILSQAGIRANSQSLYLKSLKSPTPLRWAKLLSLLSTVDRQFKSGENSSFWQSILKITLNLSKSYTHNRAFCI